ncbi:hypothetical protein CPB86DRAFT_778867 [Serendipita vermifera]|nr:hypothetical protein CPB86DRAFT_778867 [Serendipita vermifera]
MEKLKAEAAEIAALKEKANRERSMPAFPHPFIHPMDMLFRCTMHRMQMEENEADGAERYNFKQTYVGQEIPCSSTPLEKLKQSTLRDLKVRCHNKGSYLLCRIITPPSRLVCVAVGIEDKNGWSQFLSIYNFPGAHYASSDELDTIFPLFTVLAIREPLIKMALSADHSHIRVDSPSDLIFLDPSDAILRKVRWRMGEAPNPVLERSPQTWKDLGDGHFRRKEYFAAIVAYSYALRRSSSIVALRLNRSLAHLRLENYASALRDAQVALDFKDLTKADRVKALYRSGQAEYGAGNYAEARRWYQKCLDLEPNLVDAAKGIRDCNIREEERNNGTYDWEKMFKQVVDKKPVLDIADFIGPVEIVDMPHRGGGRGVIATRDITPGELLVVSKPFVSAPPFEPGQREAVTPLNFLTNLVDSNSQYGVLQKAVRKVAMNPHLAPQLYNLYGGEGFPPVPKVSAASSSKHIVLLESPINFSVDVDAARIQAICSFNAFSTPAISPLATFEPSEDVGKENQDTEIHTIPSYFNHSCVPNADRIHFSGVLVVRAVQAIKKGDEIFMSYRAHSETFEERSKHIISWLKRCDCELCCCDRKVSTVQIKKRRRLLDQIRESGASIKQMKKAIKEIDATFPKEYPSVRFEVMMAHRLFTRKLEKLVYIREDSSLRIEIIQSQMSTLEAMGVIVTDKGISSVPTPSKTGGKSLPISTSRVPYFALHTGMTCVMICCGFACIGIEWRAEKWLRAALWVEDQQMGGGIALFKLKYTNIIGALDSVLPRLLHLIERDK